MSIRRLVVRIFEAILLVSLAAGLFGAILVLYGAEGVTYSDGKTLVLFTIELVTERGETVLFDPPWAKKGKR